MLTGKAKIHFETWLYDEYSISVSNLPRFYEKTEIEQLAYYIDFFDSVGIYIHIYPTRLDHTDVPNWVWFVEVNDKEHAFEIEHKSRPEATKAAVEKANHLLNEKLG